MSHRILTTHTGSLPRADGLGTSTSLADAVRWIVDRQLQLGLDIVDDGEQSKTGFVSYVNDRLGGFTATDAPLDPYPASREYAAFPEFYAAERRQTRSPGHLACTAPVTYTGHAQLRRDIDNLRAALRGREPAGAFIPCASPASIEGHHRNAYYPDTQAYLFAIADAMREEYRAIVDAGFLVQIDDPRLAMAWTLDAGMDLRGLYDWAELRIAALNRALAGIPPERVRHHTCYGINMGPRATEIEMKHLVPLLLQINADGYSFEFGNPRHEHEWSIWERAPLPDGKYLIPGVISHTTVLVEHPELVAQRILHFARVVGAERVVAGSDCGFASNPRAVPEVHPTIVWAKLQSLAEGARLASAQVR